MVPPHASSDPDFPISLTASVSPEEMRTMRCTAAKLGFGGRGAKCVVDRVTRALPSIGSSRAQALLRLADSSSRRWFSVHEIAEEFGQRICIYLGCRLTLPVIVQGEWLR